MVYIGIDLHRYFFQAAKINEEGKILLNLRFPNNCEAVERLLKKELKEEKPIAVVVEATRNWMWLVDELEKRGCQVKLAHPLKLKAIYSDSKKTDKIDALKLAQLLKASLIPQSYIMPKKYRDNRELVRLRQDLVKLSTLIKNRIHALLGKKNYYFQGSDLFGKKGEMFLKTCCFSQTESLITDNLLISLKTITERIKRVNEEIEKRGGNDGKVKLLTSLPGFGITTAFLLVYEIGDVWRFPTAKHFVSYFGLVPKVSQSGNHTYLGRITKIGNPLVRWALVQAAHRVIRVSPQAKRFFNRLSYRSGKKKAIVAVARKLAVGTYFTLKLGKPADFNRLFGNPAILPGC